MLNTYTRHFVSMAKIAHRRGLQLQREGLPAQAFAKFVQRDLLMERARGK